MAASSIIEQFKNGMNFRDWYERLEFMFIASSVDTDEKKRAMFLTNISAEMFNLLKNLIHPQKLSDTTLDALKTTLEGQLNPEPNEIMERYKFNMRNRGDCESITDYIIELRKLAKTCNYGDKMKEMIRDRIVCGIKEVNIQRRLLSKGKGLTFEGAIEIALAMESAEKEAASIRQESIHTLPASKGGRFSGKSCFRCGSKDHLADSCRNQSGRICFRCGSRNHEAETCGFKEAECYGCHKRGHTARMCKSKKTAKPDNARELEEVMGDMKVAEDNVFDLYKCEVSRVDPFIVHLSVNGRLVKMEVDTGASLSVISEEGFKKLRQTNLEGTDIVMKTYSGEKIAALGVAEVEVEWKNAIKKLPLIVMPGQTSMLLGRNWMRELEIGIPELMKVEEAGKTQLEDLLKKFSGVFQEELGTMADIEVHIELREDARPVFHKARPVPYALKQKVEEALDRMVELGSHIQVPYSDWATPIVPVAKEDGSIRICGDYKVSVNPRAKCDYYPVPKTEDLLSTLNGGDKFTKLDLSNAYQQLRLDADSQEVLTINTHKGLYRPLRLQFGVHSAAGIFQREIEKRITGIPFTIVRVDDILISGENDQDHLSNVERVLKVLEGNKLRLRRNKCHFMEDKVKYLGFIISNQGIEVLPEKIAAIRDAPAPQNVTQVKSFLGMINYYHRHMPCLSAKLEPLHELLRKGTEWKWGVRQKEAFAKAKEMLTDSKLLVHFNANLPIKVNCDASPYGVGAVLTHEMSDGIEKPVAYASRTLTVAERNYSHLEKESLAIVFAIKKFHQFLWGQQFKITTDHKPLIGLFGPHKPIPSLAAARIQRWSLMLSAYNYELAYKSGLSNANADGLSRLPLPAQAQDITQGANTAWMLNMDRAPVTATMVAAETRKDPILRQVMDYVLGGWPEGEFNGELLSYKKKSSELTVENGVVLWGCRVIIPFTLKIQVLEELHMVHSGMVRMKQLARSYVHWFGMDEDIEQHAGSCETCVLSSNNPAKAPPHAWEKSMRPWQRIHLDHAGPSKGHWFLVAYDSYSKWIDVHVVTSTSSVVTIEKLRRMFATHGLPETIVTDNGTGFTSSEFEAFMNKNGITHVTSAPYHPSSNGPAERSVQTVKKALMKLDGEENCSLETKVSRLLFSHRCTPNSTTGVSPAEALMKRRLRCRLSNVRDFKAAKDTDVNKRAARTFRIGDMVIARSYNNDKWVKGTVVSHVGAVMYGVQVSDGNIIRRHVDQLRGTPHLQPVLPEMDLHVEGDNTESPSPATPIQAAQIPDEPPMQEDEVGMDSTMVHDEMPASTQATRKAVTPQATLRKSVRVRRAPSRLEAYE